jgi:tetratricopeptide (TPR) repeat protein
MRRLSSNARASGLGLIFLAVLTGSGHARADAADDAIKRGVELRRERKDAEALEQFQLAQRVRSSPRGLAQVALAEQALGRWSEAERDLQSALQVKNDAWIESHRSVLEKALEAVQEHLQADGSGSGPKAAAPPAPSTGLMPAAPEAPAKSPAAAPAPTSAPSTLTPPATTMPSSTTAADVPHRDAAAAPPLAAAQSDNRTGAWLAIGGVVAFAAGGIAANVVHEKAAAAFNDNHRCFYGDETRAQRCEGDLNRAHISGALAAMGYGGAALLSGLAAYLWLKPGQESPSQVGLSLGPDHAFVAYRLELGKVH